MQLTTDHEVEAVFQKYPDGVREKLLRLRSLILQTAEEMQNIQSLEETLKWGEPSYISKKGSTLRLDWKPKNPEYYALYFTCSSRLVPTFRVLYPDVFAFEGKRAILLPIKEVLPEQELKKCIQAALEYHQVKHLPYLGIS